MKKTQYKKSSYINMEAYIKTKKGLVSVIYGGQRANSKKRGDAPPTYSKEEFKDWLFSQDSFHILYDNWKRLDYQKEYKPSIDRKDDYIGYTMSNIQLMTWRDNRDKGHNDRRNGVNNKRNKAVLQYTKTGEFVAEHYSISQSSRDTGINIGNISECCAGNRKSAGGFRWEHV